jgi:membrane protein YdbS with pleckstrin-like domain
MPTQENNQMSYVEKNLMAGEQVVYRTSRHWIIFRRPILIFLIGLLLFLAGQFWKDQQEAATVGNYAFAVLALLAIVVAIPSWIDRLSSEFAVTNKRVIVKVGWVQRRSIETLLSKIEAIEVLQGIGGRIFGYGTIIVIGTGGTKEPFERIAAPLEFRRRVQEQIIAFQQQVRDR